MAEIGGDGGDDAAAAAGIDSSSFKFHEVRAKFSQQVHRSSSTIDSKQQNRKVMTVSELKRVFESQNSINNSPETASAVNQISTHNQPTSSAHFQHHHHQSVHQTRPILPPKPKTLKLPSLPENSAAKLKNEISVNNSSMETSPVLLAPHKIRISSSASDSDQTDCKSEGTEEAEEANTETDDNSEASPAKKNDPGQKSHDLEKGDTFHTALIKDMQESGKLQSLVASISINKDDSGDKIEFLRQPAISPPEAPPRRIKAPKEGQETQNNPSLLHSLRSTISSTSSGGSDDIPEPADLVSTSSFPFSIVFSGKNDADLFNTAQYDDVGDQGEASRLKKLHAIAHEFLQNQASYVNLLHQISVNYPEFLRQCAVRRNKKSPLDDHKHVVHQIANHLKTILGFHKEVLFNEFERVLQCWDSRTPNLAHVLLKNADILKVCGPFLKEKQALQELLKNALESDRDLNVATKKFEERIFGRKVSTTMSSDLPNSDSGIATSSNSLLSDFASSVQLNGSPKISIVNHLDSIHQNIVRYELLMQRYVKYLPENHPEKSIAEEALKKLTAVTATINESLCGADENMKMLDLHQKIGRVFDVFSPGRKLVHQGDLYRQTRKELQKRHLILFSDTLLIFKYSIGSCERFDLSKFYKLSITQVRIQIRAHEDYEQEFILESPKKSSAFVAKNKSERDRWIQRINEAQNQAKKSKKLKKMAKAISSASSALMRTESGVGSDLSETSSFFSGSSVKRQKKLFRSKNKALWIPDDKVTGCMIARCDTKFDIIHRRHHCRECGWIICDRCAGKAPVYSMDYQMENVCPECYNKIKMAFESGSLFPPQMIVEICQNVPDCTQPEGPKRYSLNDPQIRIVHNNHFILPAKLFREPENVGYLRRRRQTVAEADEKPTVLASGYVYLKKGNKMEQHWAQLSPDPLLQFFEAEFDENPVELHVIFGRTLEVTDLFDETSSGGRRFELIHRNQIQTERKEERIVFEIRNAKLANKWHELLEELLTDSINLR